MPREGVIEACHISRQDQGGGHYCTTPPNDSKGPSNLAAAIDINLSPAWMKTITARLINAIDRKDPRAKHIAEVYGTVNGTSVTGRLFGDYATSDTSHLWHVHMAMYRDSVTNEQAVRDVLSIITGGGSAPTPTPKPTEVKDMASANLEGVFKDWKIPADNKFHGVAWGTQRAYGNWGTKGKSQVVSYKATFRLSGVVAGDVVQGRLVFKDKANKIYAVQNLQPVTVDAQSIRDSEFVYSPAEETHKLNDGAGMMIDLRIFSERPGAPTIALAPSSRRSCMYWVG